ncbi:MAG: efflux RND transporter periplasmic adaptor subunit [Xanthomonadales bacterium]|nr:efflux RND transporter periplasmic adaptor subunit [Xanthomonadales bacterium]
MNAQIARFPHRKLAALVPQALLLAFALTLAGCSGGDKDAAAEKGGKDKKEQVAKDEKKSEGKDDSAPKLGKDGKPEKEIKPVPVEVAPVIRRTVEASYTGTASLEAPEEAQVVAKTSGVLLELLVEEGDSVKAGQVLARIDADRARLEVQRAEATLRKLEAEFARSKELFERKLVAADAHERLRFDVATQKAAWDLAKLELSYTQITAPIGGLVAQRMVKRGNLIQLNQTLFRVVGDERLEAVLNVPEREMRTLHDGMSVVLNVDAVPGKRFDGVIDRVSPVIDASTGTFRATASFSGHDGVLKPGMFGRIAIVYDRREDALAVPRVALLEEEAEPAVFVVRDGQVKHTVVGLGHVNGEYAEITAGLEEGDQVVTAGKVAVRDGTKVNIIAPSAALAAQMAEAVAGN